MKTKAVSAELFAPVDLKNLTHGIYPGVWGGYEVVFHISANQYRLRTDKGIRTLRAECLVIINNDGVSIEIPEKS